VAYQVVGDGPFDVILVPGFVSHVELVWSVEPRAVILRQLASFSRLIVFDKRGTGMSDRVAGAPTLETRMDDVRAVMDAAGSERAALVGFSEGAPMSVLFAATYPERTAALVLWGAFARMLVAVDYPMGSSDEEYRRELEADLRLFGTREEAEEVVRSIGTHDPEAVRLLADYYRRSASPGAVESLSRMNAEIDVRQVLPAIACRRWLCTVVRTSKFRLPVDAISQNESQEHDSHRSRAGMCRKATRPPRWPKRSSSSFQRCGTRGSGMTSSPNASSQR